MTSFNYHYSTLLIFNFMYMGTLTIIIVLSCAQAGIKHTHPAINTQSSKTDTNDKVPEIPESHPALQIKAQSPLQLAAWSAVLRSHPDTEFAGYI